MIKNKELRINIKENEGQLVVSSREVGVNFNKRHCDVLRDIENIIKDVGVTQNCVDLFVENKYQHEQNKQWYKGGNL